MIKNVNSLSKLESPFLGPYKILKRNRGGAYILTELKRGEISKKFPPNLLKKVAVEDVEDRFYVENIVDHKLTDGNLYYRVRWFGCSPDEDTWELTDAFDDQRAIKSYWKRKQLSPRSGGE